jgi:hypothetical protein
MSTGEVYTEGNLTLAQMLYAILEELPQGTKTNIGTIYLEKLQKLEKKPEGTEGFESFLATESRPPMGYKFKINLGSIDDPEKVVEDMLNLTDEYANVISKSHDDSKGRSVSIGREFSVQGEKEALIRTSVIYEKRRPFSRGSIPVTVEIEVNNEKGINVMLQKLEKYNFDLSSDIQKLYQETQEKKKKMNETAKS